MCLMPLQPSVSRVQLCAAGAATRDAVVVAAVCAEEVMSECVGMPDAVADELVPRKNINAWFCFKY